MGRNYAIDFYKFLFSCIIFILHIRKYGNFGPNEMFNGGYLAVEFFFIVSGFFMMSSISKKGICGNETPGLFTFKYLFTRYKHLMPQYWLSIVVLLLVNKIINPGFQIIKNLQKGFPSIFAFQIFIDGSVHSQLWFVSALLWASALVYYLILKSKDFSIYVLFPFGILTYLGLIKSKIGYIDLVNNEKFYLAAFGRAFFEIAFGCVLCEIFIKIQHKKLNPILMSGVEIILSVIVIIVMWRTRRDYKDFIMVFLLGVLIVILALNRGYVSKMLNNKFSAFLGSISYSIYVNQNAFQQFSLQKFSQYNFYTIICISLGLTILYSIFITRILNQFKW